jgi:Tol biopolymer transport system component
VTDDVALDWNPVWSPDGNHLYFLSDRSGSMNLWRVPIEEKTGKVLGPPEPLTTPATDTAHLSISRDGRRIAYVQRVASLNIHKVGFDPAAGTVTGQSVAVTRGSRLAGIPDVSPDGEWLTFYSWGKPADIFIIRTDGTGLRQLTEDIYRDLRPRWSPDGKRIAFYSNRSGRFEIWVINRDGSGLQQLTHNSLEAAVCPVWSPDGTQLAYTLYSGEAFVLDVAKAGTPQASRALPHLPDPGQRFQPRSWSGDGQRLAGDCVRPDGSFAGIAIYSFASQQYERLTDFGFSPVWLKDGRRLMFAHENKLFLVGSQTRKVRELFSAALGSDMAATLSPDNRTVYFSFASVEADIWLATLQ